MNLNQVAEEIKQLLTEAEFTARWTMIEAYHRVGQLILSLEGEVSQFVKQVSVKVGKSERTLWHAVKFAKMYERVEDLPEGKNIGWGKIVRKYLTDPSKPDEACQHLPITICAKCREVLDKPQKE